MNVASPRAMTAQDITPEWLTEVLLREHALPLGRVVSVEQEGNAAFNSNVFHLKPTYSASAAFAASMVPRRLLLKCSLKAAWAIRAGAREVAFYQLIKSLPDHPPVVVRCYDAVYDAATGVSHLLLEDLSDSHVIVVERDKQIALVDNLPSGIHLVQAVIALARFHAYWWQNPHLAEFGAIAWGCGDEEALRGEFERRRRALDHLIACEGDSFPLKELYESILAQMVHLWRRYLQPRVATLTNLTLTHGDAYLANFLSPRAGQSGDTYLIDWQSPEIYRGSSDLANMCATFWTRAQRAQGERELNVLRLYHRTLQENGVPAYAWDDLVTDYRLSIIDWLLIPLQDHYDGSRKDYWWPKMLCLAHAFEDWNCSELFSPD